MSHYTDNQAVASILSKGSRNATLQPMVVEVALALAVRHRHGDDVEVKEDGLIKWADLGSRDFHMDDISWVFNTMSEVFGVFGISIPPGAHKKAGFLC